MKLRTTLSLTALAAAAALGTTGAVLLPAASAQPLQPAAVHTLRFTTVEQAQLQFSPTFSIAEDKEVNAAGKVIGYDTVRFNFDPKTTTAVIGATINLKGGFLYGEIHQGGGPVSHGTLCGGSGAFRGATGTITVKALDASDDRSAVTITYRTAG